MTQTPPSPLNSIDPMPPVISELLQQIYDQREEILKAFVAKYQCGPDDAVQVFQYTPDGGMKFWVEKRRNEA